MRAFGLPKNVSADLPVSVGFPRPEIKVQTRDRRPESGRTFEFVWINQ